MQNSTGIHDLPTELLEKIIFDPVLEGDLISLAQISRRICSIAIPAYLARYEVVEPTKLFRANIHILRGGDGKVAAVAKRDVLSGLVLGFDIRSIHELECKFSFESDSSFDVLLKDCRRFLRIIQRLEHISIITLRFATAIQFHYNPTILLKQRFMEDLLNTLIEKGCETLYLDIAEMRHISNIWQERGFGEKLLCKARALIRSTSSTVSPTLEDTTWRVHPSIHVDFMYLSPKASQSSRLRHLTISTPTLLHPPFSHWTYSILSTPLLTSLTLSGVRLYQYSWDHIFRWMVIPLQSINHGHLLELSIEGCTGLQSASSLIEFIVQLESLMHLRLDFPMRIVSDAIIYRFHERHSVRVRRAQRKVLPNLVSLHAYSDWVDLLLPPSTPRPNLKNLFIVPRTKYAPRFDYRTMLDILHPLLIKPTLPQELDISLCLSRSIYSDSALEQDLQSFAGDSSYQHPGYGHSCDTTRITTLVLIGYNPHSGLMVNQWCGFFKLWKGLKVVRFVLPSSGSGTVGGRYMTDEALLKRVNESQLGLEKIEFGSMVYERKEGGIFRLQ